MVFKSCYFCFLNEHNKKKFIIAFSWSYMELRLNANAIITNSEGEILLIKQKKGDFAGGLNIPGGGINPGEMGFDAIKREILEETGIKSLNNIKPIGFCELTKKDIKKHRVVLLFHGNGKGNPRETEEGYCSWEKYDSVKN